MFSFIFNKFFPIIFFFYLPIRFPLPALNTRYQLLALKTAIKAGGRSLDGKTHKKTRKLVVSVIVKISSLKKLFESFYCLSFKSLTIFFYSTAEPPRKILHGGTRPLWGIEASKNFSQNWGFYVRKIYT